MTWYHTSPPVTDVMTICRRRPERRIFLLIANGSSSQTALVREANLELGEPRKRSTNGGGKSQQPQASIHQLAEDLKQLRKLVDRLRRKQRERSQAMLRSEVPTLVPYL